MYIVDKYTSESLKAREIRDSIIDYIKSIPRFNKLSNEVAHRIRNTPIVMGVELGTNRRIILEFNKKPFLVIEYKEEIK